MFIKSVSMVNKIELEKFLTEKFFFSYVIEWYITTMCNLKCRYCLRGPASMDLRKDYSEIIAKTIMLNPKLLAITGGEPTLVPLLPEILEKIRRKVNAYICLLTNLTKKEIVLKTLPYIDNLLVSLDTLDEEKSMHYRGVSPRYVLSVLQNVNEIISKRNYPIRVIVNSVVLKDTIEDLPNLNETLVDINPEIGHSLSPVTPFTHPLSIANDYNLTQHFLEIYKRLKDNKSKVVCNYEISNINGKNQCKNGKIFSKENICYRRYFRVLMHSDGKCKSPCPPADIENPVCLSPCNCAPDIDSLLKAKSKGEVSSTVFAGKFKKSEIEKLKSFVLKYINPELPEDIYEGLYAQIPSKQELPIQFKQDERNEKYFYFKPAYLLNPKYLFCRLKTIKSVSDLIKRVLNVFVLIWEILTGKYEYPLK